MIRPLRHLSRSPKKIRQYHSEIPHLQDYYLVGFHEPQYPKSIEIAPESSEDSPVWYQPHSSTRLHRNKKKYHRRPGETFYFYAHLRS